MGPVKSSFFPTSFSQTLNNEEPKKYETTCLCVSFEIFSYITLLSVLKSSRYSSSSECLHSKNTQKNRVPVVFQVQSVKHKVSTRRERWCGWVFGGICVWRGVKAEFLPMQFIRKIDICYPSWKTTSVSQSVLTKCLCAESYHTSIVLQPGSKPDHPWEMRGMVTSAWITLISLPLSDNCWETLIQIWIWRVFYSALTRIRKDQSEPDFHTSESVLTMDKTKVRWDLSDESNLASIKAGTILFQRNHHVFN